MRGSRAANRSHLSPLWIERSADRDPQPVDAQARLLLSNRRGNRLFELGLSEVALAFTAASSKSDQKAIAEIVAAQPHEGFAGTWLKRKGLDWAADMIATQTQEIAQ
jgi:type IV secretory pathway VirB4 component